MLLDHAWPRRLYNLLFATILLSAWWYLGTPAGQNVLTRLHYGDFGGEALSVQGLGGRERLRVTRGALARGLQ
jgi:hypothetical protein